ncbi:pancreatic triacylglycerol lipase-like isoform X3 [Zootermopsis nevadensis]|uniref:pancreatic triacylglycerol lipase-like isoform X3 n=1 Tax=Zootermopsis nevadensis TaxID=136037 RepID=UPI000B8EBF31|nr:pancreatic triacylglycerol lipase-like isoform X3 [Zootermopsis nevadensis]
MGRLLPWALLFLLTQDSMTTIWNAMDIRYWKCVLKRATSCPDPDIKFFMYSSSDYPHRKMVDVRNPLSLHSGGWNPGRRSVIIIHGFNETESESPTTFITKGLDPARPLVEQYTSQALRLTRDDAHIVQVIHTNAGFLGVEAPAGHVDFCVNNGQFQPGCTGHRLRQARCSHFQSACYFAATVSRQTTMGYPCTAVCPRRGRAVGLLPGIPVPMGEETPEGATGTYCVTLRHGRDCPFD